MISRGNYFEGVLFGFFLFGSNKLARLFHNQIWKLGEFTFSNIKQKTEFLDKNKIRIYAILDEGYEFPVEFAYFTKGAWDEFASIVNRKGFKVEFTVSKQLITFIVTWDKEGFFFRISRVFQWFFNIKKVLFEVTDTHSELQLQYNQLQESKWKLEKQTTQLKTAYEISTSIKQSLDIKDTLDAIANTLVKAAGFSAVYIELDKDIDENDIKIKIQTGLVTEFMTPIHREIVVNEKHIGDMAAYPSLQMSHKDVDELVDYLMPVINIAIYDALVLRAIVDYRDNLEQKVYERTNELQTARDRLAQTNNLLKQAQIIQSNFFTNISHEFRTPLTLILGPVKQMIERTKDQNFKDDLIRVHRNAYRLLELVNQLLDISKIESGNMKLQSIEQNIVPLIKALVLSFSSYAERKRITLQFSCEMDEILVYLDTDKFEKIINNVLSNAFKFTPTDGNIEVTVAPKPSSFPHLGNEKLKGGSVQIRIADTGIGIPKQKLSKIFDRFYQVDSSHTREQEGTGIGLALTKELIDLHKGKIEVESEEGKGTTVIIEIPLGKDHLKPDEIIDESERQKHDDAKIIEHISEFEESKTETKLDLESLKKESLPLLLIIEDNPDVRKYIKDNLNPEFRIIEANDGEDGWNKSLEHTPDLIVSDVMMPKIDGFKLCEKLKTDERTSHIPIILLTAKAAKQDKLDGYELGADDYIMKPFDTDVLKVRIKNLIQQRERVHQHFKQHGLIELNLAKITPTDRKFLQTFYEIIIKNISDPDFGIDQLVEKINLSRSVLHRKIISLIGEAPGELIRRTRINKAAELIENKFGNLSEIALEVGFSNPAYFSEAFKKQFGVTPSQYQHKFSNS